MILSFNAQNALKKSSFISSKTISGIAVDKPSVVHLNYVANLECFLKIFRLTGKMSANMFS